MLTLRDISGKEISRGVKKLSLRKGRANYYDVNLYVECPELWTPDSPILHQLEIKLVDGNGILIDGMLQKVGIRKILLLSVTHCPILYIGAMRKNCVMREFVLYAVFITLMIQLFWMPVTNSVF